jgi:outer membrane protein insertion porin family/translocation and assembly module TamA
VRAWLGLFLLVLSISGAACHEDSGVAVKSLSFKGNSAFDDGRLGSVLATRASGRLPWSPKETFDRAEFEQDLKRLQAFYVDRGYPNARISNVAVNLNQSRDAVDLVITIDEGPPRVIDAIHLEGFDDLSSDVRPALKDLPIHAGQPDDRELVRESRDLGARLLRDNGYAHAAVDVVEQPVGSSADHLVMTLKATPGPKCYFGDINVTGLETVDEQIVRRELSFAPGDLYRESEVTRSQRRLIALQLFQFAHVNARPQDQTSTEIPVRVTVAEGRARQLKLGAGYGSEERLRGSFEWRHLNLAGGARQAVVEAKWSAIDRGVRVSLVDPYIIRRGVSLTVSGTSWHTSELTYDTNTYGGRAILTFSTDQGLTGPREPSHREVRVAYIHDYLRYGITPDSLDDLTLRSERIALGLDPDTGRASGTVSAVDVDFERAAVDDTLNPHRGSIGSIHFEHAGRFLGGSYRFDELLGEGRLFVPIGKTVVLANRIRVGTIVTRDLTSMPFSERYFLGGSSSVRGWGRFEISPLDTNGLPVGGRSLAEASSELRFPVRGKLSGVMFVDAGNVWPESRTLRPGDLRYAVGPGLRYLTPIGDIRVDLGMQMNPIPGLVVNGVPETRHWRVHFSIGQSF